MKYNDIKKSPLNTSLHRDFTPASTTTHEYGLLRSQLPINQSLTYHKSPDDLTRRLTFTN
jgi:hypothetical protein